jgi:hypothetical protein
VVLSGVVGLDALVQGEVPAPENLHRYAQFSRDCPGALHGSLGAAAKFLEVFHGRLGASTGAVIGVRGVRGHDP